MKCTIGHGGIEACERCEVEGKRVERRTVYPSTEAEERTEASFRAFRQPGHHHGPSPLTRIIPSVNLVTLFVLDFMYLCCNGIMKKLLEYWISGDLNVKLDLRRRLELSRRMESLSLQVPFEFQRKTRKTSSIAKWKATEFRFFLLYCGPVVLKKLLRNNLYEHFLLLHVAARILCFESLCHLYNNYAKMYLRSFFITLKDFYGPASQILNAHHLIHVFAFENFLGKMKRLLRRPNRPLPQVCRRLYEKSTLEIKKNVTIPPIIEILHNDPENNVTKVRYKEFTISNVTPNNMILLKNGTIASVRRMFLDHGNLKLEYQVWKKKKPMYTYPCDSGKFDMWRLYSEPLQKIKSCPITAVSTKRIQLKLSFMEGGAQKLYVIPFLH